MISPPAGLVGGGIDRTRVVGPGALAIGAGVVLTHSPHGAGQGGAAIGWQGVQPIEQTGLGGRGEIAHTRLYHCGADTVDAGAAQLIDSAPADTEGVGRLCKGLNQRTPRQQIAGTVVTEPIGKILPFLGLAATFGANRPRTVGACSHLGKGGFPIDRVLGVVGSGGRVPVSPISILAQTVIEARVVRHTGTGAIGAVVAKAPDAGQVAHTGQVDHPTADRIHRVPVGSRHRRFGLAPGWRTGACRWQRVGGQRPGLVAHLWVVVDRVGIGRAHDFLPPVGAAALGRDGPDEMTGQDGVVARIHPD